MQSMLVRNGQVNSPLQTVWKKYSEWMRWMRCFFFFFFWSRSVEIKNMSSFLGQTEEGNDVKESELKSAAWSTQCASELDQIVCVLRGVSGSPVKLAQWHEFLAERKKKKHTQDITITAIFLSVFYSTALHPIEPCKKKEKKKERNPPPHLSSPNKATFWSCAKQVFA